MNGNTIKDLPPILNKFLKYSDKFGVADTNYCWCTDIAEYLKASYPEGNNYPAFDKLWTNNGRLCIKRKMIDVEKYELVLTLRKDAIKSEITIPINEIDLSDNMASGRIAICSGHFYSSKCSKCTEEYKDCHCSTFLDVDVHKIMTSM